MIKAEQDYVPESGYKFTYDDDGTVIKTNDVELIKVLVDYLNDEI